MSSFGDLSTKKTWTNQNECSRRRIIWSRSGAQYIKRGLESMFSQAGEEKAKEKC